MIDMSALLVWRFATVFQFHKKHYFCEFLVGADIDCGGFVAAAGPATETICKGGLQDKEKARQSDEIQQQ